MGNGSQQESKKTKSGLMPWCERDADELSETVLEALAILGPQLVVQEDPDGVKAVRPGQAQLAVDALGVKRSLPETSQAD